MIKAVIFDMDGVMVDTERIHSKAFEDILADHGIVAEKNEHGIVHTPGDTSDVSWEKFKAVYGFEADTRELTKRKRAASVAVLERGVESMSGLVPLLQDLQSHGILLGVATSAQRGRTDLLLDTLGVASYFNAVVAANDVEHAKPAPDLYLKAAELLGVTPDECVVLEDTQNGVASAKAAGMRVIAVPNEYTKRMDFTQADMQVLSLEGITYNKLNLLSTKSH